MGFFNTTTKRVQRFQSTLDCHISTAKSMALDVEEPFVPEEDLETGAFPKTEPSDPPIPRGRGATTSQQLFARPRTPHPSIPECQPLLGSRFDPSSPPPPGIMKEGPVWDGRGVRVQSRRPLRGPCGRCVISKPSDMNTCRIPHAQMLPHTLTFLHEARTPTHSLTTQYQLPIHKDARMRMCTLQHP